MVTVDPARDTPQQLATYMTAFNPSFLGLYSDPATTEAAASAFKVFYSPTEVASSDHAAHEHTQASAPVLIDHSAGSYIFDAKGKIRLYVRDDAPVDAIVSDLKWLLGQT
jgi:protein SCO1/2